MKGFALPTLMVMLALTSIAALLAMRNLWVNEQLLNTHADQLRTQQKAEAVLPVALADILGTAINKDAVPNLRHSAGDITQTHAFFPNSMTEYNLLRQRLGSVAGTCSAGICAPHALVPNAINASYWKTQTPTAITVGAADTPYGDDTAWYWVEVFPQHSTDNTHPSSANLFVYRITTLANGIMPSSTVVLQAIWVRSTPNTGQWQSWHVLHD
jgi:Tfp pilus assembly protein PilX